ncbi:hypothetical protein SM0020_30962 [Sinorhizobium meliloti CCNWSX0020]|uniref:Uncharacterized protein n=1 Tax=Sinorhizobium meliloti CCNWSX0020 TaxID=1107881 RepID=H0G9I5_RHIML|nr:hypothetical protein SM0020_30962 [Sinorhizobium meliloti CCNWSX0020]
MTRCFFAGYRRGTRRVVMPFRRDDVLRLPA